MYCHAKWCIPVRNNVHIITLATNWELNITPLAHQLLGYVTLSTSNYSSMEGMSDLQFKKYGVHHFGTNELNDDMTQPHMNSTNTQAISLSHSNSFHILIFPQDPVQHYPFISISVFKVTASPFMHLFHTSKLTYKYHNWGIQSGMLGQFILQINASPGHSNMRQLHTLTELPQSICTTPENHVLQV